MQPDLRSSLWSVVAALFQPKLIIPLAVMFCYVYGLLHAGSAVGVWHSGLITDTITWGVGSGIALFGWSVRVFKPGGSFRRVIRTSVSATLFVEAFVNLYVFPLPVELLLLPIGALIAGMSAVAESDRQYAGPKYAPLKRMLAGVTTALGLVLIGWVSGQPGHRVAQLRRSSQRREGQPEGEGQLLATLPCIAVLGAFASYDSAFAMIRWASADRRERARARVALAWELRLRARHVNAFNGQWCKELTSARSLDEPEASFGAFAHRP